MDDREYLVNYSRKGSLTSRKLREYIPTMMLTNMSVMLILSADSLVAGKLLGSNALNSIGIFTPITVALGTLAALFSNGISTSLSTAMGKNDSEEIRRIKGACRYLAFFAVIIIAVIQIPIIALMIHSYNLPEEVHRLTWQYAIGMMMCFPASVITTIGTYELQVTGKTKMVLWLSVIEGALDIVFDLIFAGLFKMGIVGVGFGSALACAIRAAITIFYITRYTDMFKSGPYRFSFKDAREIITCGIPTAAYQLVSVFQSYSMLRIILHVFGTEGATINSVCSFCCNFAFILIGGIIDGMRPLMGLFTGSGDEKGLSILMKQGCLFNLSAAGLATVLVLLMPQAFFYVHGVKTIPAGGILCLRLFSLCFLARGFNSILRLYFTNRKDTLYATNLNLLCNATLPVFAFLLMTTGNGPVVFLSYLLQELFVLAIASKRYLWWKSYVRNNRKAKDEIVLYMTVRPDQAVSASRELRSLAKKWGIAPGISYKIALCMEEMVYFAKTDRLATETEIMIRYYGTDKAIFVMLDNGNCISFTEDKDVQKLITNHFGMMKKIASKVEYQFILNMNYTKFLFQLRGSSGAKPHLNSGQPEETIAL